MMSKGIKTGKTSDNNDDEREKIIMLSNIQAKENVQRNCESSRSHNIAG